MVGIFDLWLPILLSAVFVFVVSSIIHMVLPYHKNDFSKIPKEDEVLDALSKFDIPPGDYYLPFASGMEAMKDEAYVAKLNKGPVAFMTILPSGPPAMGASLVQWFLASIVVSVFTAYITGHTVNAGSDYLAVFRVAGTVAFMGYGLALIQNSIWYKRNWGATMKHVFDSLIYGLVTAGAFGWLWPGM